MKQATLIGRRQSRIEDIGTALLPGVGEVAVEVRACGVCASELHPWQSGDATPRRLGHEVAGVVVATGDDVSGFEIGDRVTGLFSKGFAERAITSADRVAHIPDSIAFNDAYGEPLACAVSAARRTQVDLGDRVAIVGLGFMGLLTMQLLRLKGPTELLGIDPRDDARAAALRVGGADRAIAPDAIADDDRVVLPYTVGDGRGFDVVVEATGTQAGLALAGELVGEHGILSILGYHQAIRHVDMKLWNFKALDVLNAHERRPDYRMDCMRRGLALAASGRIDLASLTTHRFPLEQIDEAFAALESKPPGFIKSVIVADGTGNGRGTADRPAAPAGTSIT